jgi:hypothetical protein
MARSKRANGAGRIYIKHGSYYGRWITPAGGRTNRRLGPVRRPGTSSGLTRTQAEKTLREMMREITIVSDPAVTIAVAGNALLESLEARGASRSHIETEESHLRTHLVPHFTEKPLDRIVEADVTRLLARLRRLGRKPKTIRNVLSALHSVFEARDPPPPDLGEPVQAGGPPGGDPDRGHPLSDAARAPGRPRARRPPRRDGRGGAARST